MTVFCLVLLAGLGGGKKPPPTPHPLGHWKVVLRARSVAVTQTEGERSHQAAPSFPAGLFGKPQLVLACQEGRLTAGFLPHRVLASLPQPKGASKPGARRFGYRLGFDDEPPRDFSFSASGFEPAIAMDKPHAFVKDLLAHRVVTLTVTPLKEESKATAFDLSGLSEVVAPVREACGTVDGKQGSGVLARRLGGWEVAVQGSFVVVSEASAAEWPSFDGLGKKAKPELILRCATGDKDAYLFYSWGLPRADTDLFVRFDGEAQPKKYYGGASQDGKSVFFSGFWSRGTDGFVRSLLEHKTLTLALKPKKLPSPPDATFDLEGLESALKEWTQACTLK